MEISKKMEKIRSIVESPVVFRIGMKKSGEYDLLGIDVCSSRDDPIMEIEADADYIG
jgi:hypothetical protein